MDKFRRNFDPQYGSEHAVAPGGRPNIEITPFGTPEAGTAWISVLVPVDTMMC